MTAEFIYLGTKADISWWWVVSSEISWKHMSVGLKQSMLDPLSNLHARTVFLLPAPTLCQCIRKRNVEFSSLSIVCHSPRYHASFPNLNDPFRQRDMSSRSSIWYRGEMDFIKFLSLSLLLYTHFLAAKAVAHTQYWAFSFERSTEVFLSKSIFLKLQIWKCPFLREADQLWSPPIPS